MFEKLRSLALMGDDDGEAAELRTPLAPLRVLAAQLLLTTGAAATIQQRSERARAADSPAITGRGRRPRRSEAAVWAPLAIGAAAAAAQLVHTARPSEATNAAMRVFNGAVVGVSIARLAEAAVAGDTEIRAALLPPLALASAGLLGFLVDREAAEVEAERAHLERRASVVERLVPKRRPKLEGIVVHV